MCGILGSVNHSFDQKQLDLIKHRGPDDSGIEVCKIKENVIRFGQRRLSIVDLSDAGHQPMYTNCGKYVIILNGEIYNHQELKEKLPEEIKFRGHSDTETILYYLKIFGINGLKDLNGIFALAFLDVENKKLLLARDPVGVKPLYYSVGINNDLLFSSEIRPIKELNETNDLDEGALATLLRLRYNPAPDTIYNSIKKISPGHYCEIDLAGDKIKIIQTSYVQALPDTIKTSNNIVDLYGQKLEAAVKRQLLSDVPVGILLSGGIDSALVAAMAKKHYEGNLKAFTIGFEGDYSEDEIAEASETATLLGLDHRYKKISFTDFLNIIKKCTNIVEEPLATTSIIPMYFLSELASKEVKVVLTGQGADEPLGGYTRYKSELVRHAIPKMLRRCLMPLGKAIPVKNDNISRGIGTLGIDNDIDRLLSIWEVFSIDEIKKLISVDDRCTYNKILYWYNILNCESKKHPVERIMALDTRLNLADDLLNYTDKITMNFALECRVPMLDLELLRFIESLPHYLKLNLAKGKIIHKKFANEILPGKIINRKKKGFLSPTNNWFKNESDIIKEILLSGGTNFSKTMNQKFVADIIEKHKNGINKEKQIFLLLSLYFWFDSLK